MEQRKELEQLARRKGVVLAPAPAPASAPTSGAATAKSTGWLANVMPAGAQLMADLKAQLPPEIYAAALDELKRGAGYVVDRSTWIAVGAPPLDQYQRGRVEQRAGLTVMRVRPIPQPEPLAAPPVGARVAPRRAPG